MIIDDIKNLQHYIAVIPELKDIITFMSEHNLEQLPEGRVEMDSIHGFVNIQTVPCKGIDGAVWESHRKMIDLQIPLTGDEIICYSPLSIVAEADYDEEKDLTFHPGTMSNPMMIRKGMFAIFFPQDVHAPGVTSMPIKKAVFKIPVKNE